MASLPYSLSLSSLIAIVLFFVARRFVSVASSENCSKQVLCSTYATWIASLSYEQHQSPPIQYTILFGICASIALTKILKPQIKFVWYCFLRPIGGTDQKTRLERVRYLRSIYGFRSRSAFSFTKDRQKCMMLQEMASYKGVTLC